MTEKRALPLLKNSELRSNDPRLVGRGPKQIDEYSHSSKEESVGNNWALTSNQTVSSLLPRSVPGTTIQPSIPVLPDSLTTLKKIISNFNRAQAVYNQDKFPPLTDTGLVLIVQTHKRDRYLKQLLESLKVAKGIENVLLVISHDHYYDEMNKMIRDIDFCRVSCNLNVCVSIMWLTSRCHDHE